MTVEELREMLMVLFNYRANVRGLEIVAVFRIRAPPDLGLCSAVTKEAGDKIWSSVLDGTF